MTQENKVGETMPRMAQPGPGAITREPCQVRHERLYSDRLVACLPGRNRTVVAMLDDAVANHATSAAVEQGDAAWSYGDLDAKVGQIAGALAALGVQAGERIALFMGNSPEFVALLHGIWRVGAIAVPVGERQSRSDLARILSHCEATVLFFEAHLQARVGLGSEGFETLRACICVDAVTSHDTLGYQDFLQGASERPARPNIDEQSAACLIYTSGTTGHPKGVLLSHIGFWHTAENYRRHMRYGPGERFLLAIPGTHISGLVAVVLSCLRVAGCLVLMREFRAPEVLDALERRRITSAVMVPAMYNLLLLQPGADRRDLSSWRIGHFGGAPMPAVTIERLAEWWPRLELHNGYGATETTSAVTLGMTSSSASDRESVGYVLPCMDVRVLDDGGHEVPEGEAGELWIRSPGNAIGYWRDEAATASSFVAGYWRSGDVATLDARGRIRLLDRLKDVINRGGFKVYATEVEAHLQRFPGVLEVAAVASPCAVLGERIHVFVHSDRPVSLEALRVHCRDELADYKVPDYLTSWGGPLPRNQNGKVSKPELRARAAELAPRHVLSTSTPKTSS